jgi:DnaJ-class molecular chaperone
MRDPYSVLNVSRSAGPEEIKSAWRAVAKAVHPDMNKDDPQANARFAEAGKAYDVLRDPQKRSQYDLEQARRDNRHRKPTIMEQRAQARQNEDAKRQQAEAAAASAGKQEPQRESAEEIINRIFGKGEEASRRAERAAGDTPSETHEEAARRPVLSAAELFAGLLRKLTRTTELPEKAPDLPVDITVSIEDLLAGNRATAELPDGKSMKITLPQGVTDGQTIRLPDVGFRFPGMARGDVVARMRIAPHPLFKPDGYHLRIVLPVDIENAVLGCETMVDTPDGLSTLVIPPWSGSDRTLVVAGQGLPMDTGGRGDLLVDVRVMLWDHPDSKVTDLMRSLREGLFL